MASSGSCDSPIYAVLRRSRRVWAIGSIYGAAERLAALHQKLAERFLPGDRIVYLGNVLGCGAAVAETVDELLRFRAAVIAQPFGFAADVAILRGAQEEMWQKLLELQFASNPREVLAFVLAQGVGATILAYGGDPRQGEAACRDGVLAITRWTSALRARLNHMPGHAQFMAALRRAAFTDVGSLLFVNAGIDPTKPLDLQRDNFWWGGASLLELAQPYESYQRVVRGYDRRHGGLVESRYAVSIDGGVDGPLTAACFDLGGSLLDRVDA